MNNNSNASQELKIQPFNMNKVKKGNIIVVIGKKNTGKSVLIKNILYHLHKLDIPIGTVVSYTDRLNKYYEKFIPSMLIHSEYSPELLTQILERQNRASQEGWKNPHAFLVFDDALADANAWKKDKNMKEIFFNGRHYNLTFILAMQHLMGIPPDFRANIDFVFLLKNNIPADRKKIYDNYAGCFAEKRLFDEVFPMLTSNYKCMVIDNQTQSELLTDNVFVYKGNPNLDFKMCTSKLWKISNAEYDSTINRDKKVKKNYREVKTKTGNYKVKI